MEDVTLLIGHRGAGKSELLHRLSALHPDWRCLDLDDEIERITGESISALFAKGEESFRSLERRTLDFVLQTKTEKTVISLGAGFDGPLPPHAHVVWVRRATDAHGRSFLNRPRLNPERSPHRESLDRFAIREPRYRALAHEEVTLPEGYDGGLEDFFTGWTIEGDLTLLPQDFRSWPTFIAKRSKWGIRRFEIRDDLLSPEQIKLARASIPTEKLVYSVRRTDTPVPDDLELDWPLELGEPVGHPKIISLHTREPLFESTLTRLSAHEGILKLAVEIKSIRELAAGHMWWCEDPQRRAFLPRSSDGRWRWYRSLFGPRMPIHFIREGEGSSLDQPLVWQSRLQPPYKEKFAAVLGRPTGHSRTPIEHHGYFARKSMPVVAIDVPEDEFEDGLRTLRALGLTHAAVTSPLKKLAAKIATHPSPDVRDLGAANTLLIDGVNIYAHNTDWLALNQLKRDLPAATSVWLWGGGGVKSSVLRVWPEAKEISARVGVPASEGAPDLLIWATGRSRDFQFPPVNPKQILDLNYGDDSPGLELAVRENLPYQSGLKMFKLQAELQRQFWESHAR